MKCRAYAKALHYKEDEFHKGPNTQILESLIRLKMFLVLFNIWPSFSFNSPQPSLNSINLSFSNKFTLSLRLGEELMN